MEYKEHSKYHILEGPLHLIFLNKETYFVEKFFYRREKSNSAYGRIEYNESGKPTSIKEVIRNKDNEILRSHSEKLTWSGETLIKFEDNLGNYYEEGMYSHGNPFWDYTPFAGYLSEMVINQLDNLYAYYLKDHHQQKILENIYENVKLNAREWVTRWGKHSIDKYL